jgi:hypothetical protein
MTRTLAEALGDPVGRVDLRRHFARMEVLFRSVPQEVWPSTGKLNGIHKGKTAIICGGGPSLAKTFPALEASKNAGAIVFAPNKSHDWLIKGERAKRRNRYIRKPLVPDYGVLVDPSEHVADYITPHKDVHYLLGVTLHYKAYMRFLEANSKVSLWVPTHAKDASDIMLAAQRWPERDMQFIQNGSTVGLRTCGLVHSMEPDVLELHGFDSCYLPGTRDLYTYDKPFTTTQYSNPTVIADNGDQLRFEANTHMSIQALEFDSFCKRLDAVIINGEVRPMNIVVHGDGVIPWMAWKSPSPNIRHADPASMEAKYGDAKYFDYARGKAQNAPFVVPDDTPIAISGVDMQIPSFQA